MYPGEDVPAGGIITGTGTVEGLKVMIVANDSTYVVIRPLFDQSDLTEMPESREAHTTL